MQITLGFLRIPISLPLNWWGHLVCQTAPYKLGKREWGVTIDNSWGADWGDDGEGILDEEHAQGSNGMFAPLSSSFFEPDGQ
jgi:hypothetical protein